MFRQHYCVDVSLNDLASFDGELADKIRRSPTEMMPLFEEAAKEVADEVEDFNQHIADSMMGSPVCMYVWKA